MIMGEQNLYKRIERERGIKPSKKTIEKLRYAAANNRKLIDQERAFQADLKIKKRLAEVEERKLEIELRKLEIEEERLKMDKKPS